MDGASSQTTKCRKGMVFHGIPYSYYPPPLPVTGLALRSAPGCINVMSKRQGALAQVAALPYRIVGGRVQVLLITSRGKQQWIIPKGWAEKGVKPHAMAAQEAFEEAGVRGRIGKQPYGSYHYTKRLKDKRSVKCLVAVYLLEVEEELEEWPERDERQRRWVSSFQAPLYIRRLSLTTMLLHLGFAGPIGIPSSASKKYGPVKRSALILRSIIGDIKN
jgi:8-oxo-dGTP pyrophosphatase MutT (NUDIX family)